MPPATLLVTGASGTVGSRLAARLGDAPDVRLVTTTRRAGDVADARRYFDLADPARSAAALRDADAAFLLLPPGLPAAHERFGELLSGVPAGQLPHLVFMSVQGAESRGFLPHAKIERVLRERARLEPGPPPLTILRPSYFMQNLETAFGEGLRRDRVLRVPAGEAEFVWVDAGDIARAAAAVMRAPAGHEGKAYAITGTDVAGFAQAARLLSEAWGVPVRYESPNPVRYYLELRRAGEAAGMALAQTVIHVAERFTKVPPVSADYTGLTGRAPVRLEDYVGEMPYAPTGRAVTW